MENKTGYTSQNAVRNPTDLSGRGELAGREGLTTVYFLISLDVYPAVPSGRWCCC